MKAKILDQLQKLLKITPLSSSESPKPIDLSLQKNQEYSKNLLNEIFELADDVNKIYMNVLEDIKKKELKPAHPIQNIISIYSFWPSITLTFCNQFPKEIKESGLKELTDFLDLLKDDLVSLSANILITEHSMLLGLFKGPPRKSTLSGEFIQLPLVIPAQKPQEKQIPLLQLVGLYFQAQSFNAELKSVQKEDFVSFDREVALKAIGYGNAPCINYYFANHFNMLNQLIELYPNFFGEVETLAKCFVFLHKGPGCLLASQICFLAARYYLNQNHQQHAEKLAQLSLSYCRQSQNLIDKKQSEIEINNMFGSGKEFYKRKHLPIVRIIRSSLSPPLSDEDLFNQIYTQLEKNYHLLGLMSDQVPEAQLEKSVDNKFKPS